MHNPSRHFLAAAALALLACGDSPFTPTVETVAGDYHATTLTVTQANGTVNLLLGGGALTLSLHQNGTTTGHLFVPGGGEGGADFDMDLPGTWTLSGNTITFDQPNADTFIRDMPFTAERGRIRGAGDFGDVSISVVLTK